MILEALKYTKAKGEPCEWTVKGHDSELVYFGNINLIVGKNAVGKSRVLTFIQEVADMLANYIDAPHLISPTVEYELIFDDSTVKYNYNLSIVHGCVVNETLHIDGVLKLDRATNKLYSEKDHQFHPCPIPAEKLSTYLKDSVNYPYIEKLYRWGFLLRNVAFTNQFEKNHFSKDPKNFSPAPAFDLTNPGELLFMFDQGCSKFGEEFVDAIKRDMIYVGYPIKTVEILKHPLGYGLHVLEDELNELTNQLEMSQGMFRTLSFIIRLNFALLSNLSLSILIDDLGEGLDYDRAKALIDLIVKHVNSSPIQMFITTNDRYIMNKIPLHYWSVLKRNQKESIFYNYYNSKEIFEDFKYTGLSNFDFLATDFYLKGFKDQE